MDESGYDPANALDRTGADGGFQCRFVVVDCEGMEGDPRPPICPGLETRCVAENSRQGFRVLDGALHQGSSAAKSRTALGIRGTLYDAGFRSRCTGKERDAETALDNLGARYYSGGLGRFWIPDYSDSDPFPVPSADFENPQSLNLYAYVHNSPLVNIDPDGHDCVVQSSTGEKTENVSVSSGNCDNVKVGDGQFKTYVPGKTDVSLFMRDLMARASTSGTRHTREEAQAFSMQQQRRSRRIRISPTTGEIMRRDIALSHRRA